MKVWANRKFLFCCVLLLTGHTTIAQNFEDCQQVVPPFSWGGIDVDHVMGENVGIDNSSPNGVWCFGSGYFAPIPRIHLGVWEIGGPTSNPFTYTINFSKPIIQISILLLIGNQEDFVLKSSCSEVSINSLYSCYSEIHGDSIFLGTDGVGSGWFNVSFEEPTFSFSIVGSGIGNGSGFKICANSMHQAPLWAGVKGEELMCGGGSLFFERYGWLAGPYTYNYNINGGPEQSFVTDEILAEIPLTTLFGSEPAPGTYTIELTQITDGGGWAVPLSCNTSHTFTVSNPPVAQFTPSPSTGFAPATISLNNQSTNATQYQWLLNNTPITPQNNTITLQDTGAYQITLIASNALGCTDTAVQTVHVLEQLQVTIPNVFTPNNDGVNDWFGFTANVEAEANLVVLNRWGGVVFEKRFVTIAGDFMELWDGTSTGSVATPSSVPATDGVYFYKLVLSGDEWEETFVGNVTLRR